MSQESGNSLGQAGTLADRVLNLSTGYIVSYCLSAAARLGISDLLAAGPRSTDELAASTGTQAQALYRMLRTLAAEGVYTEVSPRRFALTELGGYLRSDVPHSMRNWAVMNSGPIPTAFHHLLHSLRTGETAFKQLYGKSHYEYLAEHPEDAQNFNAAMKDLSAQFTAQVLEAYDFGGLGHIVDVGSGPGTLLTAVLKQYPENRGTLMDLPHIAARARCFVAAAGLTERCDFVGGNFLESVPAGGDAYILSLILHNWSDAHCVSILRNVRAAMKPGARVILIDTMIPEGDVPHFGKPSDMVMLVVMGGQERSAAEYCRLFLQAGLRLTRVVPTQGFISVVEAVAAS
jgi:hypothetical protein